MFCSKCGKENASEAKFCGYCGERILLNMNVATEGTGVRQTKKDSDTVNFKYAGFWRRFFAVLLDGILITMVFFVPFLAYAYVRESETLKELFAVNPFLLLKWFQIKQVENPSLNFLMSAAGLFYYAVMESSTKQATLGKMALGIIVTDQNGERITFLRAAGRHLGKIISSLLLVIGFIMAAFTKRKQALHDIMASCLVIKRAESEAPQRSNINIQEKSGSKENINITSAPTAYKEPAPENHLPAEKGSAFKKAVVVCIILLFLAGGGYWIWNRYNISRLSSQLSQAELNMSASSDSTALLPALETLSSIHQKAVQNGMPLFKERYAEIGQKTIDLLIESPLKIADWVKAKRSNAWSAIGAEQNVREQVDDKDLLSTINSLKNVCETAILAEKSIMESSQKLSVKFDDLKGRNDLDREIKLTAEQAENIAQVGGEIARIKGQARAEIQKGLRQIDEANREIEKYAEVSVLQKACSDWEAAMSTIQNASAILNNIPSFELDYQNSLALSLVRSDQEKIRQMIDKITPHVAHAREELAKAEQQESTAMGQVLAVSLKSLVLGTKMFYDMMGMDSNTDLHSWSQSYESDMSRLMQDMDRIREMKGWSITGKNTIIEATVNKAYEKSFNQPAPNTKQQSAPVHQEAQPYNQMQSNKGQAIGNPEQSQGNSVSSKDSLEYKAPVKVKQVTGEVIGINRPTNTITVRSKKNDVIIICDERTKIMIGRDAGRFGDIKNGDKATVKYTEQESGNTAKVVAVKEKRGLSDNIILHEDFDSSSVLDPGKWIVWRESGSSSSPFIDAKGNPGNALNGGDRCGHMCGNHLYYNKDIPYQQGLVIEFDFWCAGSGWHYTDARVGLASNRGGEPKQIVAFQANKGDNTHQIITFVNKRDTLGVARYQPNIWHSGRIKILTDQYVEFYLDGQLIQRSSEKLADIGKPATLYIMDRSANGPAYIDNIKVWIP